MPALSGQVITTIRDGSGNPVAEVTWFFDPTTRLLRNNPADWTDSSGTVWRAGSGALIGANLLANQVTLFVTDANGALVRRVRLPANTGRAVKVNVLANQPAPDGPYTSADDFNGMSFDLTGARLA